jgi:hypothetical protein
MQMQAAALNLTLRVVNQTPRSAQLHAAALNDGYAIEARASGNYEVANYYAEQAHQLRCGCMVWWRLIGGSMSTLFTSPIHHSEET